MRFLDFDITVLSPRIIDCQRFEAAGDGEQFPVDTTLVQKMICPVDVLQQSPVEPPETGKVLELPRVAGLRHTYIRRAA